MSPYPPPPWRSCRRFDSLEALRGVINSDAVLIAASGPGAFSATIATADVGLVHMVAGHFACPTVTSGFTAAEELSATVVLASSGGSMNGVRLDAGTVVAFRPGTIFEAWSGRGYRFMTVSMSHDAAARLARDRQWRLPDPAGSDVLASRVESSEFAQLEALVGDLDLWTPTPPVSLAPAVGRFAIDVWARVLAGVWGRADPRRMPPRRRAGDAALKRAHAYIHAHLGETIRSSDLCRAARAKERTLEHWFRERFGIPPMAYLAASRLSAARDTLRRADVRDVSIADAAKAVGIRHLGRFAAAYRRMFGETPTRTRTATTTAGS